MAGIFELCTDRHSQVRFRLLAPDGTFLSRSSERGDHHQGGVGESYVLEETVAGTWPRLSRCFDGATAATAL